MSTVTNFPAKSIVQQIALASIRTEEGSQGRVKIRDTTVHDYAQAMTQQLQEGAWRFPAVVLFWDGKEYWIGDGFHRILAARKAGLSEFLAEVHSGTQRDALLYAISANSAHGLQRTSADKRKAVSLLLADPDWSQWSDREIARHCQVDNSSVSKMRKRASVENPQMRRRKVRRGGKVYEMMTATAEEPPRQPGEETSQATEAATTPAAVDLLGITLSDPMRAVFASLNDFQAARTLCMQLAGVIDRIAREPGGEVLRQRLERKTQEGMETFCHAHLEALQQELLATEPYCSSCPYCTLAHPGFDHPDCKTCRGRGWTTRAGFEGCPESYRRDMLRSVCPVAVQAG